MIEENISIVIPKPDSKTKTLDQMKQKRKDTMGRKSQKKKKQHKRQKYTKKALRSHSYYKSLLV